MRKGGRERKREGWRKMRGGGGGEKMGKRERVRDKGERAEERVRKGERGRKREGWRKIREGGGGGGGEREREDGQERESEGQRGKS